MPESADRAARSAEVPAALPAGPASCVRWQVVGVTTLASVLLYLDRVAIGQVSRNIRESLALSSAQEDWLLSAFFWSYALAQVPSGWASDRWGRRRMLVV